MSRFTLVIFIDLFLIVYVCTYVEVSTKVRGVRSLWSWSCRQLGAAKCGCWEHLSPLPELYMVTATKSFLQHLGSKIRDAL